MVETFKQTVNDPRAYIRPFPNLATKILNNGIMQPLMETGGVMFPYTPIINYSPSSEYEKYQTVHSNQDYYTFSRNPATNIQISGEFTSQTYQEAAYSLACIHFFRTITKMRFGESQDKGTPPPMLLFDAWGYYMFNRLPVFITTYNIAMENQVDYVPVQYDESVINELSYFNNYFEIENINNSRSIVWVPTKFNIALTMVVQVMPSTLRKDFDLNAFKSGNLIKTTGTKGRSGGWI